MTFWDRLAVALIGAAGFALSFDALQQMAVAIHVRGPLTYVFPFTVDGFIAYGVRTLLVLRAAPWAARVYAWFLFAGATAASVWANALHAVRLNRLLDHSSGLRLGESVVGALSTLSPLALGGAVHLYILIARHAPTPASTGPSAVTSADRTVPTSVGPDGRSGPDASVRSAVPTRADHGPSAVSDSGPTGGASAGPEFQHRSGNAGAGPVPERSAEVPFLRTVDHLPEGDEGLPAPDGGPARRTGRPPGASMDQLLEVSRPAVRAHGRPSRPVVERAVREAKLPLGSTRFTVLMDELRKEFPDDPVRQHLPVGHPDFCR
ncbi:DUF2637 domain-containing protein [Kitasatospora sp. NPDC059817]|uniref:DUF2637 domain-containing protein n=1 Tax=Kitasatospora sp. NPDC059817 TaxID=3346961 RepID=UPI00365C3584